MNTYFESPKFINKIQAVVLTASLVLFSFVPAFGFPKVAEANHGVGLSPEIAITQIEDSEGSVFNAPFSPGQFSCNTNPLIGAITISGDGQGTTPPGNIEQYGLKVDWGDGVSEVVSSVLTPPTGGPHLDFTFTFDGSHLYSSDGLRTITVRLFHQTGEGNEDFDGSPFTIETCVIVEPPTTGGLVVNKVIATGSATTDNFSFTIDEGSPITFESDGSNEFALTQGDYNIAEVADAHYTADLSSCGSSGSVTIIAGVTTTCTITNTFFNNAPLVQDLSILTDEDTASSTVLVGSDSDLDSILYALLSSPNPLSGLLSGFVSGTGAITFTPTLNFNGADSFTYQASDAYAISNTGTVSITVNPINDAPVANDDSDSTNEDIPVTTGSVLTNDTDIDGDTLSVSAADVTSANGGTVVDNTNGTFTYTPALNYSGSDTFNYTVSDGSLTDVGTVTITVSSTNDAPVAVANNYSTNEDVALNEPTAGVLTNDSDTDSDPLTAVLVANVSFGSLTLNADGSFDYTPNTDYNGPDSFTYKANDGNADSNTVTVSITVDPQNDAPVAVSQNISTSQNIPLPGVLGANDIDGDSLTYATSTSPTNGAITLFNFTSGAFTYTPNIGFSGNDSFDFMANDGFLDSNTATISITVNSTPEDVCPDDEGIQTSTDQCTSPEPEPEPEPQVSSGGGGGGGGGGNALCSNGRDDDGDGLVDSADPVCHSDGNADNPNSYIPYGNTESGGQVLGAFSGGEVLGDSCGLYLDEFIRSGLDNDAGQVVKLQTFLNKWMNAGLPITGFYGPQTQTALKAFQEKYASEVLAPWGLTGPTGIAYITTLRWINTLECPELSLAIPPLVNWSDNPALPRPPVVIVPTLNVPEQDDETGTEVESQATAETGQSAAAVQSEGSTGGFWGFLKNIFSR